MNYQLTCNDKQINIENIYQDHNNLLAALKNYLTEKTDVTDEELKLQSLLYQSLIEIDNFFKDKLISGINIFSKIVFENDYIDRVKYNLIIDILNDIEKAFIKLNLKGFYIWITLVNKNITEISYLECEEIVKTLKILIPYFDDLNVFIKYDSNGKRDPFNIDIEKSYECYYLYPVLQECLNSKKNITIINK